jgi:hypothetical protein
MRTCSGGAARAPPSTAGSCQLPVITRVHRRSRAVRHGLLECGTRPRERADRSAMTYETLDNTRVSDLITRPGAVLSGSRNQPTRWREHRTLAAARGGAARAAWAFVAAEAVRVKSHRESAAALGRRVIGRPASPTTLPGDTFRLLSVQVAYFETFLPCKLRNLPAMVERSKGTRGLIIRTSAINPSDVRRVSRSDSLLVRTGTTPFARLHGWRSWQSGAFNMGQHKRPLDCRLARLN